MLILYPFQGDGRHRGIVGIGASNECCCTKRGQKNRAAVPVVVRALSALCCLGFSLLFSSLPLAVLILLSFPLLSPLLSVFSSSLYSVSLFSSLSSFPLLSFSHHLSTTFRLSSLVTLLSTFSTCCIKLQLIVGSEDFDLRVFNEEAEMLHEFSQKEVSCQMGVSCSTTKYRIGNTQNYD